MKSFQYTRIRRCGKKDGIPQARVTQEVHELYPTRAMAVNIQYGRIRRSKNGILASFFGRIVGVMVGRLCLAVARLIWDRVQNFAARRERVKATDGTEQQYNLHVQIVNTKRLAEESISAGTGKPKPLFCI